MIADDKGTGLLAQQNTEETDPINENGVFSIYMLVDTGDNPINAADISVEYDANKIELENIRYDSSLFTVWHRIPLPEEDNLGTITLTGAAPDAFQGSQGILMEMQFSRILSGPFTLKFKDDQRLFHTFGEPMIAQTSDLYGVIRAIPKHTNPDSPKVTATSPSHPSQKQWYSQQKTIIDWSQDTENKPGDIFNYTVNQEPIFNYTENTTKDTKIHFKVPHDGQWYIHIQRERNGIKSPMNTLGFKVDTTPPEAFKTLPGQDQSTIEGLTRFLSFTTIDTMSGLAHYKVCQGTKCELLQQSPYKTNIEKPGYYKFTVQAIDRAGNIRESEAIINIQGSNYYTIEFPVNITIYILPLLGLLILLIVLAWFLLAWHRHNKDQHHRKK